MVPCPCFFIVRPDVKKQTSQGKVQTIPGPIVPVIAVDELPEWFDIVGVPRALSVEETIGLCNLGTASKSETSYAINLTHKVPAAQADAGPGQATHFHPALEPHVPAAASTTISATPSPSASATIHPAEHMKSHWSEAHAHQQAGRRGELRNSTHSPHSSVAPGLPPPSLPPPPPPATTTTIATTHYQPHPQPQPQPNPDHTPKAPEYCRHWCRHGTCKWGLQCRYVHAMSTTTEQLAGVPAWWMPMGAASATNTAIDSSDNGEGTMAFDQRDVRRAALQRLGLLPTLSPSPSATGPGAGNAGVGDRYGHGPSSTGWRTR